MSTEVVSRFVEALESRDLNAAIDCVDQSVYFVSPAEGADFSTREGFLRWWRLHGSRGSELHPLRIEALDDRHVFVELLSGHPEDGGRSWATETLGCVYSVGNEVIEAMEMFADAEGALVQARHAIELLCEDGLFQETSRSSAPRAVSAVSSARPEIL
jgi:limonene-1,2-epoxide hydrolase